MPVYIRRWGLILWQLIANGVVVGGIIAVTAVGLTLVYRILKLTNFSHGDVVTLGAYLALFLNRKWSVNPWLTLPVVFAAGAGVSVLLDRIIWRRMRHARAGVVSLIVASIGLALFLRYLVVFLFGADNVSFRLPVQMARPLGSLPVRMTPTEQYVILVALAAVLGLHLLLRYTTIGKAMRALADNMDLAWVSGINVDRVIVWTWVVGGGLATTGGVLFALTRPFNYNLGWFLLLPMFAAIILGGIGSPYGAIVGGFLIGIGQEVSTLIISNQYKHAVGFVLMIIVLLAYPRGLFGERALR